MAERARGYALRFEVKAPPELVWRTLVAPHFQAVWHPQGMELQARQGGFLRMRIDPLTEREAHVDICMPPTRLRLVYSPQRGIGSGNVVLVDDIIMDASKQGGTRLCVLGSGFPQEVEWMEFFMQVQAVWRQSCARLKILSERQAATSVP
jgi:uncharacterized protein YndB with AHSA1/START domain